MSSSSLLLSPVFRLQSRCRPLAADLDRSQFQPLDSLDSTHSPTSIHRVFVEDRLRSRRSTCIRLALDFPFQKPSLLSFTSRLDPGTARHPDLPFPAASCVASCCLVLDNTDTQTAYSDTLSSRSRLKITSHRVVLLGLQCNLRSTFRFLCFHHKP